MVTKPFHAVITVTSTSFSVRTITMLTAPSTDVMPSAAAPMKYSFKDQC
jgi:hypothetical protein